MFYKNFVIYSAHVFTEKLKDEGSTESLGSIKFSITITPDPHTTPSPDVSIAFIERAEPHEFSRFILHVLQCCVLQVFVSAVLIIMLFCICCTCIKLLPYTYGLSILIMLELLE